VSSEAILAIVCSTLLRVWRGH